MKSKCLLKFCIHKEREEISILNENENRNISTATIKKGEIFDIIRNLSSLNNYPISYYEKDVFNQIYINLILKKKIIFK